jgi:hypothetical protein
MLGALCVHHVDKVVFERLGLGGVCMHDIVKGSFWRDLRNKLFVYIIMLNVAFVETCVWSCMYTL